MDSFIFLQSFSYSSFFEMDVVESHSSILLFTNKKGTLLHVFFIESLLPSTSLESFLHSPFDPYPFLCHLLKEFLNIQLEYLSS